MRLPVAFAAEVLPHTDQQIVVVRAPQPRPFLLLGFSQLGEPLLLILWQFCDGSPGDITPERQPPGQEDHHGIRKEVDRPTAEFESARGVGAELGRALGRSATVVHEGVHQGNVHGPGVAVPEDRHRRPLTQRVPDAVAVQKVQVSALQGPPRPPAPPHPPPGGIHGQAQGSGRRDAALAAEGGYPVQQGGVVMGEPPVLVLADPVEVAVLHLP
mmetsp:Transcript_20650/g.36860  ORF Transcript_20650/g.36860 Transcript_20650/m.36860 type:complete len:214 (+) Transcript_20650:344-985(+)